MPINTKIGHYRTTTNQSWNSSSDSWNRVVTTFDGLQQTADFSNFVDVSIVKNPNWKVLVAQKKDATNGYSRSGFEYLVPFRFYGVDQSKISKARGTCRIQGTAGTGLVSPASNNTLRDMALKKVKDKLADKVADFPSLVPMAELTEMRGMIRSMADMSIRFVRNYARKVRPGKHHANPKALLKDASELWLTYSFGISPLIGETQALGAAINAYLTRGGNQIQLTGTAHEEYWSASTVATTATGNQSLRVNKRSRIYQSYKYVVGVDLSVLAGNDYGLASHFGMRLDDLPSVGWELLPYSWIADYFTTMGDYLGDTFVGPPGLTKYVLLNRLVRVEAVLEPYFERPSNVDVLEEHIHNGGYSYYSFDRTKLASLPHRALRFKTVDEIGKGVVNKLLNLTSLLGSGLKR